LPLALSKGKESHVVAEKEEEEEEEIKEGDTKNHGHLK
jgi:hypothetical protein